MICKQYKTFSEWSAVVVFLKNARETIIELAKCRIQCNLISGMIKVHSI